MIFASDLDRTLIFSDRLFINIPENTQIRVVETKDGQIISHMTEKSIEILKEIVKKITFIPVTTRTVEQFRRISIFQNECFTEYAITTNGGNILYRGEILKDWQAYIDKKLNSYPPADEIFDKFREIMNDSWVRTWRFSDERFWTVLIKDKETVPQKALEDYILWANEKKWNIYFDGTKLYIIPDFLNKWEAVKYIAQKSGEKIISAGDSLVDYPVLKNSSMGFIPSHGKLKIYLETNNIELSNVTYTEQAGIMAGEEILNNIYSQLSM